MAGGLLGPAPDCVSYGMLGREWIEFQSGTAGVELHRVAPGSERFLLSRFLVVYRRGLYRDRHRQSDP